MAEDVRVRLRLFQFGRSDESEIGSGSVYRLLAVNGTGKVTSEPEENK